MRLVNRIGLVAALLSSSAAWAAAPQWRISESSGAVSVGSRGIVKIAQRGAELGSGDIVSTGANGRAVIVRGEEYLVVAPNTRFQVADPAQSNGLMQIIEQAGNILFKIQKKSTPHFGVQTPYLAAVVKGTTFSVTVTASGASVQVTEGKVEVATPDGGARYLALPGDIGSVRAGSTDRLDVQGRENKTIQSTGPSPLAPGASFEAVQPADDTAARGDGTIAAPVPEAPVDLAATTNGMVSGTTTPVVAAAARTEIALAQPSEQKSAGPVAVVDTETASGAAASGSANDNASGNSGSDSGTPNGNANGNSGTPNGNANGNSGTPSDNANGNSGTPNGNANGNSGTPNSNANGNSGTPNGNANGNSGTPNGNANGNSGAPNGNANGSSGTPNGNANGSSGTPNGNANGKSGTPNGNANGNSGTPNGNANGNSGTPNGNANGNSGTPNGNANGSSGSNSGGSNGNGNGGNGSNGNGNGNGNNKAP